MIKEKTIEQPFIDLAEIEAITNMSASPKIVGPSVPNMPWQDRPVDSTGVMWRFDQNPIMGPREIPCALAVYNSGVLPYEGGFIGVFRVDHMDTVPFLHLGRSTDAVNWDIEHDPIGFVKEDGTPSIIEWAYDPRLVKIEDTFYISWCNSFDGHGPTIGMATTRDFKTFTQIENAFVPFNRNGVLFPRKINGHYAMFNRPSDNGQTPFGDIFISYSPDMTFWGRHRWVMGSGFEHGWWQSTKIGAGSIPIETSEGWLSFYHGVTGTCNGFIYSFGASLHDLDNPEKVLLRSYKAILTPEMDYETGGRVSNVCFPCAAISDSETGRIAVYYGAADTYMGIAFTTIDEIMEFLRNDKPREHCS